MGGQLVGVSDRQYLPPGLGVPDGAKFPMEIQVPAPDAPQTFPVVAAPPGLPPMPGAAPAPAVAPHAAPASPAPASTDPLSQKLAIIDQALAAPMAKAAPVVPTTGPAATGKPSIAPYYDRTTDSMVDPSANGATPQTGYVANTAAGGNAAAASTLGAPADIGAAVENLGSRAGHALQIAADQNLPAVGPIPSPATIDNWLATHTGGLIGNATAQQTTASPAPQVQNPAGGSGWIQSAMGLIGADPRNVVPGSFGQQMARSAAGGVTSALLPAGVAGRFVGAADPVAAGVAQSLAQAPRAAAVSGAAAGVGGTLATDAARHVGVPEAAMPYIDLAGQLVGGGLGAAGASTAISGAQGVRAAVADTSLRAPGYLRGADGFPVRDADGAPIEATGKPAEFRKAAAKVAAASGQSAPALAASIPSPAEAELVPGSQGTLGQVTGNQGLLSLERRLQTKNRDPFATRSAEQNAARVAHLATLPPAEAQARAAGEFVRARLTQLDRDTDAERARLLETVGAHDAAMGGTADPAQTGRAMAGAVERRLAPARAAGDLAVAEGERRLAGASERLGSADAVVGDKSAREVGGAALRARLKADLASLSVQRSRLFDAIDPDGNLALDVGALRRAAKGLRSELKPSAGDKLSPREEELLHLAERAPEVAAFSWLKAFRENINAATREARGLGDGSAVRRLTILKHSGVDMAISDAVERAARAEAPGVMAGETGPADAVVGRLAGHAAETGAHGVGDDTVARVRGVFAGEKDGVLNDESAPRRTVSGASGANGDGGTGGRAGSGAGSLSGSSGAKGSAPSGLRHDTSNPGIPRSATKRPESFAQLLIRHGGIKDESGELSHMGITNRTHPTLVRAAGLTHDRARALAIEHGFIPPDSSMQPNRSSVNDVRDLLSREASGDRVFRPEDTAEAREQDAHAQGADHQAHAVDAARGQVLDALDEAHGEAGWLPPEWLETAARDVVMGKTPHEAVHDAETGWARETLDADTARRAFGPEIGMPAGAEQAGLSVGGGSALKPNFDADAANRFTRANAFHGEVKERFGGPVADVLAPGKNGAEHTLPDSAVVGNFWKGRDASGKLDAAGRVKALVAALGSHEAAAEALSDYAVRDLRAVAGRDGGFNVDKVKSWLVAHDDALRAFPELRAKIGTVAKAQKALDDLRAKRAEIEKLNPLKAGQTGADTVAQFVQGGPKSGEAVDAYMRHAGGTPEARAALEDGLLSTLRRKAMVDGSVNLQKLEGWRRDYAGALARLPDLAAKVGDLAGAQRAVEDAGARATAARDAYTSSAARHYLPRSGADVEPESAAAAVLRSPTSSSDAASLVQQMRGDPAALAGLRKGFADHLTTLAGTTQMRGAAFRKFVEDPKTARTLAAIFTPDQIGVIKSIAADIERSSRTIEANKIAGSPGTAADWLAAKPAEHDLAGPLGAEGVGELVGHLASLHGVAAIAARLGALVGRHYIVRGQAAGAKRVDDIVTQMILHPELGRAGLQLVKAEKPGLGLINRFRGVAGNLALAGQAMPTTPPFLGAQ
jgi:hypothetical protein